MLHSEPQACADAILEARQYYLAPIPVGANHARVVATNVFMPEAEALEALNLSCLFRQARPSLR
jgi:hypothetical protein